MPSIMVGQKGTLQFLASQAGLQQDQIDTVSFQPQGSQQAVKFSPPDKVEGQAAGKSSYKASVKMKAAGEHYSFPFDVDCYEPMPPAMPVMSPITIIPEPTPVPPPPPMPGQTAPPAA